MSSTQTALITDSTRKARILASLKTLVNDLTGINPENIDVHANFLEAGIDSLTLIQATQLVKEQFDVKLSVVQLLEQLSNIDALASYVDRELPAEAIAETPQVAPTVEAAPVPIVAQIQPVTLPAAPPKLPEVHALQPRPIDGSSSALDQIMSQQLQVMAQQLEMMRAAYQNGSAIPQTPPPPAPPIQVAATTTPAEPTVVHPAPPASTSSRPSFVQNQAPYVPYQPIEPGPTGGLTEQQRRHLDGLIARHNSRTGESKRLTQEYRRYLSDSRSTFGFRLLWKELIYPVIGERSAGSKVWDVDGNEYLDISMGFGVHLFGHSPDFVDEAMRNQIERKSLQLGPQVKLAGRVAQLVSELTGLERVNFCNSGTEAVMGALRLARTVTRRSRVAIFSGAYHGWWDGTLAKSQTVKGEQRSVPVAPGISAKAVEDLVVLDWDNPASIEYLNQHAHELAAVMVEPVQSRRPDIQPREFLHELRRLTTRTGAALIFDEMITGFRIHRGGAQAWFGVQADIATYGKVIGGGLPIGAIAGKPAFMDAFDGGMWNYGDASYPEAEKTIFAGAFFKHPLTMAAGQAILERLRDNPSLLPELNDRTARLVATLNRYFADAEVPINVVHFGSLFRFIFAPELKFVDLFFYHMLDHGVFIWEGRNCFLSLAHTDDDLDRIVRAVQGSVEQMQSGGFWPDPPRGSNGGRAQTNSKPANVAARAALEAAEQSRDARASPAAPRFSLYYFGNYESEFSDDKYELLIEGAKYADEHAFEAVWIPERHFHAFGGFSPNPSVVAAALARETRRLHIRAGSVVLPLHNPIRVAEEWSVVDNLSRGRVGISIASGWQPNDFVFAPDAFAKRHEHMYRGIEVVQKLWRGETVQTRSGDGKDISVRLAPMPMNPHLPIWLTGASERTFAKAGELGTRVLSNLQDQTIDELAEKIAIYRAALAQHGHDPAIAHVTLLLHTFVTADLDEAREKARQPLYRYMRSSLGLMGNLVKGSGKPIDLKQLSEEDLEYFLAAGYKRYTETASLIGTPESCAVIVDRLTEIGVTEIGCMVDFGVDTESVLGSLHTLNALREKYETSTKEPETITVAPEPARLIPLTDAQRQLWINTQIGPDASRAYNESVTLRIRGPFDPVAMRTALDQLVNRHDMLRATFPAEGQGQLIHPSLDVDIPLLDFSEIEEDVREAHAEVWITVEMGEPYDLEHGPLVRFRMVRMSDDLHLLVLGNHHLVADGRSWTVLLGDLKSFYTAARSGVTPDLPTARSFNEFFERQRAIQDDAKALSSENYWVELFADSLPLLRLPTDRPRPPVQTYNGARIVVPTGPLLFDRVKQLCAQQGSTVYQTLLTAYSVLLHRLSNQERIIIGVPAAGQLAVGRKDVVGYCVNLMPFLSDITGNPAFTDYLAGNKRRLMEGLEHQHYSFGSLLKKLDVPWDPSRSPLFTTIFNIDRSDAAMKFYDLEIQVMPNQTNWARYDLRMNIIETDTELILDCIFNTDLFDETTIRRWMDHFQILLGSICDDAGFRVQNAPLMSASQLRQVIVTWNDTRTDHPLDAGFHRLFEAQAELTPDSVAVIFEHEELTYWELNVRSNRLASYLRRRGVGPEVAVALYFERSAEMIVALLAVMKAGGAYVPIDPASPNARIRYTLDDSAAPIVLTHEKHRPVFEGARVEVVCLDSDRNEWAEESGEDLEGGASAANVAYIIYTSGSTGQPKGVSIEHRQLLNYVRSVSQSLSLPKEGSFATVSTLAADLGHTMIFPALSNGGTLQVIAEDKLFNPDALAEYFHRHQVDCLKIVPSHLEALLTALNPEQVLPRSRLILGGESARPALLSQLSRLEPSCDIFNHYGPTEATVGVLTFHVPKSRLSQLHSLPLGRPIGNARVYLLDTQMQPVPPGVEGELYLGGAGVARGYHDRPGLTAERFVPDPFSSERGARLYRTGDVGRYLRDGEIEFVGRADNQVKIRGLRIEPGEIEAMLREHAAVRDAIVMAREHALGVKNLVAYLLDQPAQPRPTTQELRQHLSERLPKYAEPSAFVFLAEFPLNRNGKVDRQTLPAPDGARSQTSAKSLVPATEVEQELTKLWSDVLMVEEVGVDDNFFDLGGNSLLATQVFSRVRKVFGVELNLRSLFEAPTPAGLAKRVLAALREDTTGGEIPLVRVARGESLPLSFAQQRLWFIDRLEGGHSTFYNIPIALRLLGPLNVAALEQTLVTLVGRHEVLRTHFVEVDGEPMQVVEDVPASVLEHEDLSGLPESERETAIKQLAAQESQRPFDLAAGPLLRARLARISDNDHAIMLTMHHIIGDGWSHNVLIREVASLYNDFADGGSGHGVLPELPLQYADFAVWQRRWLSGDTLQKQLDYWRRQLLGAPRLIALPLDRKRPAVQTYNGATFGRMLPNSLATALEDLSRREGATMFMTLLAAFQALLNRYAGQDDVVVGSPIANRNRAEIENIVGFFVNTLVFRTSFQDDPAFDELLRRVRETALGAYAHQDLPFEMLVEDLQPERSLSHTPLFQVLFNWHSSTSNEALDLHGLMVQPLSTPTKSAKFDLTVSTFETGKGVATVFDYNTDLFDEQTIKRMADHFEMLLERVVAEPQRRLSELSFLTVAEKQQLLVEWNDTAIDYESPRLLHELVAAQVVRTPDEVALIFGDEQLSYAELYRRANVLANELRRRGVGPDTRVGICMKRSVEMVVALLGVLQAGGAYVPLDPDYPSERLLFMLEDSQPAVLLTLRTFVEQLPQYGRAETICLDEWQWNESQIDEDLSADVTPANLAYVIYTSGSTGKPKGAMNTHEGVVNRLLWMQQRYGLTSTDVVLQKTPFSFDVSVWEFFWPLMTGARLVLARPDGHKDPPYLAELIEREQVTTVHFVPSMLQSFLVFAELKRCAGLKRVICSGEALSPELQDRFHSVLGAELHNLYGPTEASVDVTHWTCQRDDAGGQVPIGRPIANTEIYILDSGGQPVPHGLAGELHIGGIGLARGYLNKPDLTAERFVPHPFATTPGARLYRTGDRARYRADGQIEYLGRVDHQVKLRGFRIELAEIEFALAEHPAIRECAVIARETLPGEMGLVAYVVQQSEVNDEELRRHLKQSLPDYMLPASFVRLPEMPLTHNGKIDRRALPAPGKEHRTAAEFIAPRTSLESQLAQIWEDLLNVRPISINQSFFDLGGHSLLAVRLIARIHQQLGLDLPISVLFQGETIERLAILIAEQEQGAVRWSPLVPIQPLGSRLPFFCVHAVGGNVNNFYQLARELGTEQPFYGLQAPQLHEVEEEETTIEKIAARYLEAVIPVVGDGPYLLGGYSFGSYVAYEMARQLEQRGKRVGLLLVIDSYSPLYLNQLSHTHSVADLLISLAWVTAREKGQQLMLSADDLRGLEFDDQLRFFLDKMAESNLVPPELDYALVRRFVKGFAVRRTAAYTYMPPKYGGRLTLLKCEEIDALMTQRMIDVELDPREPAFGWRELCNEVEVHNVPGHHDRVCQPPYVQRLAARIHDCLERAAQKELAAAGA